MFKHREKTKEFFKKNIAMLLAVVMLFSSFSSAGMAISSIFADPTGTMTQAEHQLAAKGDEGANFVNELVEITSEHVPYVWGGWQRDPYGPRGVDCRGFVRVGFRDTYGLDIFYTAGYICDINGNPILKNGQKQWIDMAAYAPEESWKPYVGNYICVEGNGIKTYYKLICAGTINESKTQNNMKFASGYSADNVYDITHPTTGRKYSSLLAWACQYPGTIIAHNGHYGVGIGQFNSTEEMLAAYPGLDTWAASSKNKDANGNVVLKDSSDRVARYDSAAYNKGNTYAEGTMAYYFGKTWYLNSSGTNVGIRADNWTSMGKADNDSELCVMLCLGSEEVFDVTFDKYDVTTNERLAGAEYGIYTNSACTGTPIKKFTTNNSANGVQVSLARGTYYVKEISVPHNGYSLSTTVTKVVVDGSANARVSLYNNPVNGTVAVRKVDAHTTTKALPGATFMVQEWNGTDYVDIVKLEYDAASQLYVIPSSYNNGELKYTNTNKGQFQLVETEAPKGYQNSNYKQLFSIVDNKSDFFTVTNVAMLQLRVEKYEAGTNTKLSGAEFEFSYTDDYGREQVLTAISVGGVAVFDEIPEFAVHAGKLREITPPSGYKVPAIWDAGQMVALGKTEGFNSDGTAFVTTIKVNNIKINVNEDTPVTHGNITITKYGEYWWDYIFGSGSPKVNGAKYNIYTDPACTQIAFNKNGDPMLYLESGTDGPGTVIARDLPVGYYYIREELAPNDYAVQPEVFVVNLLPDAAIDGVLNIQLIDEQVADFRQIVEININKTDSASGKPVEGAIYEIRLQDNDDMLISAESMELFIPGGYILGYYKTDSNGNLVIDRLNTSVQDADGRWYRPDGFDNYLSANLYAGTLTNPSLPNGKYVLREVYAPEGYVLDETAILVDATWVNNSTDKDIHITEREGGIVSSVTVAPAGYTMYVNLELTNDRQTVAIPLEKTDSVSGAHTSSTWYPIGNYYDDAVKAGLVATLEGAVYHVYNATDIKDINTGDIIPANTLIGVYETQYIDGVNGFIADKINVGPYAGSALPNGTYNVVEVEAPQGYTLNDFVYSTEHYGLWQRETKQATITTPKIETSDELLMQQIEIHKVSSADNSTVLAGAVFEVYSVADLLAAGITIPYDTTANQSNGYYPINRTQLLQAINDSSVQPQFDLKYNQREGAWENNESTWTTNEDGVATTGHFIYGDYILVEVAPPVGYEPGNASYIRIPWVSLTNENQTIGDDDVGGYGGALVHDIDVQPYLLGAEYTFYSTTVTNKPEKHDITVVKHWDDADNYFGLRPDNITVILKADGVEVDRTVLSNANNWTYTFRNLDIHPANSNATINYTFDEICDSAYYTRTSPDGASTIVNKCTYELPTQDIVVTKTWFDNNNFFNIRPESINVTLYANGIVIQTAIMTPPQENPNSHIWTYTFEDMPVKYMPNGEEIEYTISEDAIPDYDGTIVGFDIINSCTHEPIVDVVVNKVWEHGDNTLIPTQATVQLYANGQPSGAPVVLNAENNWQYTWSLLEYDSEYNKIQYEIKEINIPQYYDYVIAQSGNTFTITNTYQAPELFDLVIEKKWDDADNKYGNRPEFVTFKLYIDGVEQDKAITITEDMGWTATWKNLYRYRNNGLSDELVEYSVVELKPAHYNDSYNRVGDKITITNTDAYVPTKVEINKYEIVDIHGTKQAVSGAKLKLVDEDGNVAITYDGVKCEWTSTNKVHVIDGLRPGVYRLIEVEAPSGYITSAPVLVVVEDITDIQRFEMRNDKTHVSINKLDSTSENSVSGAVLAIVDAQNNPVKDTDGNPIEWMTNGTTRTVYGLPVGSYYVVEKSAPLGYITTDKIPFTVVDDAEADVVVNVYNDRVLGTIDITKIEESNNNAPLRDVEFQIISVNDVFDPITGKTIYQKDQVVATLTTDANGKAQLSNDIEIFTYDESGYKDAIVFKIIETKAPAGGQYDPADVNFEFTFNNNELKDGEEVIRKSFVFNNEKPSIIASKNGSPATFVGDYNVRENVTVVGNTDKLTYTITITNNGAGKAWNVVVKDSIPANTVFDKFETNEHHAQYDATNKILYWTIDELAPGAHVDLVFHVNVNTNDACEIVNIAQYAMPDKKPITDADKLNPATNTIWNNTNAVVHQVVVFEKTSTVVGGKDRTDATSVNAGDTIKYHLTFKSTNVVNNVIVKDKIPTGLTYVLGSAKINGVVDGDAGFDADGNFVFSKVDVNGEFKFEFEVTVDELTDRDIMYFENIASATYDCNGSDTHTLTSDCVTHKTEKKLTVTKTATPITFEGEAANAKNVTVVKAGETITYKLNIANNGTSVIRNVVVSDIIPEGLKYEGQTVEREDVKSWIDENLLTWVIPQLSVGEEVIIEFKASVVEQKAALIINSAKYGTVTTVGENAPVLGENANKTNDVVHQVIEFNKMAVVAGGTTLENATAVAVGDKITYTLELIAKHDLTNVTFQDTIPDGLTFVEGSMFVKGEGDADWTPIEQIGQDNGGANFDTSVDVKAGKFYVKFDTVVNRIKVNTTNTFLNNATVECDKFTGTDSDERTSVKSNDVTHMTDSKIDGNKTSSIPTFVGAYAEKDNVTVIKNGDEITYTITVNNTGLSTLKGVVIKDIVPQFTTLKSIDNDGVYNEETNTIVWTVDEIANGDSATVTFTVVCNTEDKACEIRNQAAYAVPVDMNNIADDEWIVTDEVIHQTVTLSKEASIEYGTNDSDAKYVKIGTQFTYIIKYNSTNNTYNLMVQDKIPAGLKYVAGTAKYTLPNQETVSVENVEIDENGIIYFPIIGVVPAGESIFVFDVIVEDVEKFDQEYTFVNKATALLTERKDVEDAVTLETNTVSHKTKKSETIDTPQLGLETTNPVVVWSMISIISAISAIALGTYSLRNRKKKK